MNTLRCTIIIHDSSLLIMFIKHLELRQEIFVYLEEGGYKDAKKLPIPIF